MFLIYYYLNKDLRYDVICTVVCKVYCVCVWCSGTHYCTCNGVMIITTVCIDNHYDTRNGVVVHTYVYVIM